jgi:hypothetical protein
MNSSIFAVTCSSDLIAYFASAADGGSAESWPKIALQAATCEKLQQIIPDAYSFQSNNSLLVFWLVASAVAELTLTHVKSLKSL